MSPPGTSVHAAALRWSAAAGLLAAALVHAMAISPHYEHWHAAGIFFALLAAAEAALAVTLAASSRPPVAIAGIALNAATVALWVVSRTVGLPFGPESGHAEVTGTADLLATGLELVSIAAAGFMLAGRSLSVHPRLVQHLAGASLTGVLLVGTGLAAAPSLAAHSHDSGSPTHTHAAGTADHDHQAPAPGTPATQLASSVAPEQAGVPGPVTGYVDVHGHRVAGDPADGAALGHPPAPQSASAPRCTTPAQPGHHAESKMTVAADEMRFDRQSLRLVEGLNVVTLANRDRAPHNISVPDPVSPQCPPLFEGSMVLAESSGRYEITLPQGEYEFRCDLHPDMVGRVVVAHHH